MTSSGRKRLVAASASAALTASCLVVFRAQADGQQAQQARIVVDDQDAGFALGGMRCG